MTDSQRVDRSDVCILGAGIAGLNALAVAAQYLGPNGKVVLVDQRPRVGGMWLDTYDYVRLHQPYQLFTAGNIKWTLGRERGYLASKPEILDHLQHCMDVVARRVDLDARFGWAYVSHEETDGIVRVTLRDPSGHERLVETKRLIKAFGFQVEPNPPLPVTSHRVRSTTPNDLAQVIESDAPVWIIGGGKTGLDTAHLLITRCPGREVNMVVGRGSIALRRDVLLPEGIRGRWFGGLPFTTLGDGLAKRYDGTNEDEVLRWYYATLGTGPTGEKCDFAHGFGGVTSDAEMAVINGGLRRADNEYFTDAVDRDGSTELKFRSGRTEQVPQGTWLVNCTGLLLRGSHPYEPFVSPSGCTLSIQQRSTAIPLTLQAAYFLTHLMFTEGLHTLPLYELDAEDLRDKMGRSPVPPGFPLTLYNLSLAFDYLPNKVFAGFGSDLLLWYPLPRRLAAMVRFQRTHRRDRERHRATLDTIHKRYDVRCGPLEHLTGQV
ncbi:FAD-dependent oxidoreductase [Mycolicibacterium mucogenicum]|uniref:FAD-dependent oxidoreductase n=1 Tax=Mycolicibacterium mucogenicum DSM 44124 TaxID=1226753 RepID=A0A8H2PH86_MYCMU|nr:FAD-dependent oxidoreductase [Mycolicibacterium mucogenicum]KAB7751147.1 FAD dependent oxidoreductase [Mycolicibacterium mucogenicum DSM 44124]QPG66930.1 FAD-dependent oxidoreductase [Mycolicibacterium mucogenicum DSM 44124]